MNKVYRIEQMEHFPLVPMRGARGGASSGLARQTCTWVQTSLGIGRSVAPPKFICKQQQQQQTRKNKQRQAIEAHDIS